MPPGHRAPEEEGQGWQASPDPHAHTLEGEKRVRRGCCPSITAQDSTEAYRGPVHWERMCSPVPGGDSAAAVESRAAMVGSPVREALAR